MSGLDSMLNQAIRCGADGNLMQAVALFDQLLAADPLNLSGLQGMALAQGQMGNAELALRFIDRASAAHPDNFLAHYHGGRILAESNRHPEAVACYERAIVLRPEQAEAHHQRAVLLKTLRRYQQALDSCGRAIVLRPDYSDAHNDQGSILWDMARYEEALACCETAIALRPDFAEAYGNRGSVLHHLGRYPEALISCERAILFQPAYAAAHSNLGMVLCSLGRYEEAAACCERAIFLSRDYAEAYCNRGSALRDLGRSDDALISCDRAIALEPALAESYNNRGVVLKDSGRYRGALTSYNQAIALKPDYAEALNNKGLLLLLMGNVKAGWPLREWRWKTTHLKGRRRDFRQPLWLGTGSIQGKTLLLHAEQGLGDTIQFVRYVPWVEALGAQVILEAPAPLIPLLRTLKGNFRLITHGEPLPDFDAHCPLMSLPLAFHTTLEMIPTEIPYLATDPLRRRAWQARLGEKHRPRIGLAWSGNPANKNDRNRSLPLSLLAPYLPPAFDYHILQKEVRPADEAVLCEHPHLHRHEEALTDFAETATLIMEMDLILSVDTSVAHAAGALGKAVWLLLPFSPDWRWLTDRTDSPWYPSARLFRQQRPGVWGGVLGEVREALAEPGLIR